MGSQVYKQELTLRHNEFATIVNRETGETREVKKRAYSNLKVGDDLISKTEPFKKDFSRSWDYIWDELSALELRAMVKMVLMAKYKTNSLEHLNDKTTLHELSDTLGVSINKVKGVLERLYHFGVYRKYEVVDKNNPHTKFWVLNPYLSYSGGVIKEELSIPFKDTMIARVYKLGNEIKL